MTPYNKNVEENPEAFNHKPLDVFTAPKNESDADDESGESDDSED